MPATASSARTGQEQQRTVRLHVITGKGGTGKTTVAAALALALASRGRDVLLCEVEGRQGIARLFDVESLPYAERRIASGLHHGGALYALHIDPESALLEYLSMYYRLGRAAKALDRFGFVDFATTIAPGVRDVLLTGKVYEAAKPDRHGRHTRRYDAVVLDAPPTGRIARFLNVNDELAGLARVGPIKNQADNVTRLIRSPMTAVHLVTLLEEMPVQETVEGIADLRASGLPVGGVVVNMVRPGDLDAEALSAATRDAIDPAALEKDLQGVGVEVTPGLVDGLLAEARDHAERRALEDAQRAVVEGLDRPTYELPRLPGGVDLGGLYELAAALADQGMAGTAAPVDAGAGR